MSAQAIPADKAGTRQVIRLPAANSAIWPLVAIAVLLAMQFSMVFTRAINWDEYSYFREVAWFVQGDLGRPLQTFHVRLFAWLPGLFSTSTDHIVAARVVMFCCELVTLASIVAIARRFGSMQAALLAALAYISAGFVMQHGMSFRVDPIATALLCASLAIIARARMGTLAIAGFAVLAGMAAMVTVKVILYLPAFAGIALWRWQQDKWSLSYLKRLVVAAVAAVVAFAVFYALHAQGVTTDAGVGGSTQKVVDSAAGWSFFLGIPPYWKMALKAGLTAPVLALSAAILPVWIWRSKTMGMQRIALLGLWLPIVSLLFYTNTAAYFYVFIFAPLAIACTPVLDLATRRYSVQLLALVMLVCGSGIWLLEDRATIDRQRQLETNVQQVFAEPVAYFDHNYMLGGWLKVNDFLTPWGLDYYRRRGTLAYREAMEERPVPLFLANHTLLQETITGQRDDLFFPADLAALRENYIEFSWPIWVAGKDFSGRHGTFDEEFLVPGPYTIAGGEIVIDGTRHANGNVVTIERGLHRVELAAEEAVKLVWGDHLQSPANPLEPGDLYVEF